jgi:hypothetical protein
VSEAETSGLAWRKSSVSGSGGCVEAAPDGLTVRVRHSRRPAGPNIIYTRTEWAAFIAGVKRGEFDFPEAE